MKRKVRKGAHRPESLSKFLADFPEVWGVYVGHGCVDGTNPLEWRDVDAHAHVIAGDEWRGWICIADQRKVITENRNPTHLFLHEIAHIVCCSASHGEHWRDTLIEFGASREAAKYFKKKPRGTKPLN